MQTGLRQQLQLHDHQWLLGVLPKQLAKLTDLRNASAHSETVRGTELDQVRREVLGIGEEGMLAKLVRARMRAGV